MCFNCASQWYNLQSNLLGVKKVKLWESLRWIISKKIGTIPPSYITPWSDVPEELLSIKSRKTELMHEYLPWMTLLTGSTRLINQ